MTSQTTLAAFKLAVPHFVGTGVDTDTSCPPKANSSKRLVGALALTLLASQTGAAYADKVSLAQRTMAGPDTIPPGFGSASRNSIDSEIAQSQHQGTAVASVVLKIKEASGLTWVELADMLGVERRTLHFWASGRPINAPNETRLRRTHAVLTKLKRPSQGTVRDLMWEAVAGKSLLDLLRAENFEAATDLVKGLNTNIQPSKPSYEQPTFISSLLVESEYVPPEPSRASSVRRRRR